MLAALATFAVSLLALPEATPTPTARDVELLAYSAERRPIRAVVVGARSAPRRVLVVGCIHGNECAGVAVTRRLAHAPAPDRSVLWVVHRLNPDGAVLGVRQNARGVDLNRNFPAGWQPSGRRWDAEHSGPRPLSEPETRAARRLVFHVRPHATIWFHQPQAVVRAWGRSVPAARRYARLAGMPFRRIPWPPGTAPNWQNHRFPGTSSFVVELPSGPLSHRETARHARAARRLL